MSTATLLQKMQELKSRFVVVSCEETARSLFDELNQQRQQFEGIHGLLRTTPEYLQAAEIHRELLDEALRWNRDWRQEMLLHLYYT